jgi:hypothetical protein
LVLPVAKLLSVYKVNLECLELEADVDAQLGAVTKEVGSNSPWSRINHSDYKPELISRPHNNTGTKLTPIAICV